MSACRDYTRRRCSLRLSPWQVAAVSREAQQVVAPLLEVGPAVPPAPVAGPRNCVACMSAPQLKRFQPCGHASCCAGCAERILAAPELCPTCRVPITGVVDASEEEFPPASSDPAVRGVLCVRAQLLDCFDWCPSAWYPSPREQYMKRLTARARTIPLTIHRLRGVRWMPSRLPSRR
jgi:hypothetical protein